MATLEDASTIASRLPGTVRSENGLAFTVMLSGKAKGYAWAWNERVHPKRARVPNPKVLAILVPNLTMKDAILESCGDKFFTEQHYNDFPAVLVRLDRIEIDELEDLLIEAWRCKAPRELQRAYDGL